MNGAAVRFPDSASFQNRGDEGGGEGIAGTDGVLDLDGRGWEKGNNFRSEDIASVGSAGENQHFEVIILHQSPALVLRVDFRKTKDAAHDVELLIVDLQYIAFCDGVVYYLSGVEPLTEVDVEDNKSVIIFGHCIEEAVYRIP